MNASDAPDDTPLHASAGSGHMEVVRKQLCEQMTRKALQRLNVLNCFLKKDFLNDVLNA